MKTRILLSYLVASAIARFTNPSQSSAKMVVPMGTNITVQWDGEWPQWNAESDPEEVIYLWLTTYFGNTYALKLAELPDVRNGGEWNWTVDVPEGFEDDTDFCFRLREHDDGDDYNGYLESNASPKFRITEALEASSTRTPSFSTRESATSSSAATSTAIPSNTATSSGLKPSQGQETPNIESTPQASRNDSHTASPGVIAGAVVGSLVGMMAVVGAAICCLRTGRRHKSKTKGNYSDPRLQQGAANNAPAMSMAMNFNYRKYKTNGLPE